MAGKFYAVRQGRVPGIYTSWDDCKAQVHGYSGASYKSFTRREDAVQFINGGEQAYAPETDNVLESDCSAVAYTDGSFDIKTKRFALGAVLFYGGGEVTFSECFSDPELAVMRNVAGEIMGARRIMEYCIEKNIDSVEIRYDYEGVEKWCSGEWRANKNGTIDYKRYYESIKDSLRIRFTKVRGHSGDKFNDMADSLAKAALGI